MTKTMPVTDRQAPEVHDLELECADCLDTFTLSSGAQKFFWERGLANTKRCVACRKERKRAREEGRLAW
jgi:hypothetical protein